MTSIALYRCPEYAPGLIDPIVRDCLSLAAFSHGDKILVKANMLAARSPERCVTTHPTVVDSVCRALLDLGCRPTISDSPGIEPFRLVAKISGLADVGARLGVPVKELSRSTLCPPMKGRKNRRLELSADALEADKIVNLPKMKTHCQMQLTLAVKNLFGTVVGQRKAQWHYAVGLDRERFADLLLDIPQSLPPVLSILDGVQGMEGRGPTNGIPRDYGLVAASADPVALDAAVSAIMGLPLDNYALLRVARTRNIGNWGLKDVNWLGDFDPQTRLKNVQIPALDALSLAPKFLDGFARRFLSSQPVQIRRRCVACGRCAQICPAGALRLDEKILRFDYEKCIRCYCCHEMCPADAIGFHEGILMRLIAAVRGR